MDKHTDDEVTKIYKNLMNHKNVKLRLRRLAVDTEKFKEELSDDKQREFELIVVAHLTVQSLHIIEAIETALRYKKKNK